MKKLLLFYLVILVGCQEKHLIRNNETGLFGYTVIYNSGSVFHSPSEDPFYKRVFPLNDHEIIQEVYRWDETIYIETYIVDKKDRFLENDVRIKRWTGSEINDMDEMFITAYDYTIKIQKENMLTDSIIKNQIKLLDESLIE